VAWSAQNFLAGANLLTSSEQQYFVWDTASQSTKWQDMPKVWGAWPSWLPWLRLCSDAYDCAYILDSVVQKALSLPFSNVPLTSCGTHGEWDWIDPRNRASALLEVGAKFRKKHTERFEHAYHEHVVDPHCTHHDPPPAAVWGFNVPETECILLNDCITTEKFTASFSPKQYFCSKLHKNNQWLQKRSTKIFQHVSCEYILVSELRSAAVRDQCQVHGECSSADQCANSKTTTPFPCQLKVALSCRNGMYRATKANSREKHITAWFLIAV